MFKKNTAKKADKGLIVITIAVILLVVFVIGVLVVKIVDSTGLVNRLTTVATSKTTSASECVLAYYEYESMEEQLQECYYQWLYWSYGLMEDTNGITSIYSDYAEYAINVIGYYKEQGAYEANALSAIESYLSLYEAALDQGLKLDESELKMIEENYDALTDSALAQKLGITEVPLLIKTYTDVKANKSDIMKALKIKALANKYYNKYIEDTANGYRSQHIGDAGVFDTYVAEHKSDLYSTTYKTYTYSASDDAVAARLKDAKSVDEIRTILADVVAEKNYDSVYGEYMNNVESKPEGLDTAAEKEEIIGAAKETEAEESTDEETTAAEETTVAETSDETTEEVTVSYTYEQAKALVINRLQTLIDEEKAKVKEDSEANQAYDEQGSATYDTLDEAKKWIITAKTGETKMVQTPSTSDEDTTVSCVLYEIVKESHLDDTLTRDYAYACFDYAKAVAEGETTAEGSETRTKEDAKALAESFKAAIVKANWNSAYSFQVVSSLGEYSSAYSDAQVKTDIKDGDAVAVLNDWVFDLNRKAGDIEIIEGDNAYYVVMLTSINSVAWVETVIDAKVSDDWTNKADQLIIDYDVKLTSKFQAKLDAYKAANTTAEETTEAEETAADTTVADTTVEEATAADTTLEETTVEETEAA